ncbi:hypothetical protein TKK_0008102 [Trichogramma kaykai]
MNDTSSPTALWRTLRGLGVTPSGPPSPLNYFTTDTLAQHYASISSCSLPISSEIIDSICSIPLTQSRPALSLQPITTSHIIKLITTISSKSMGLDDISSPMLSLASSTLSTPLTLIINTSITTATFPHTWKLASTIPLSKTSSPSSPNDTRPIALLPEMSKILECVIHTLLITYLIDHDLLSPHQHGFRPSHSTQTAILNITERVRSAIDERMVSVLVSFDFSKAFDTIPHRQLLVRLHDTQIISHVPPSQFRDLVSRMSADANAVHQWAMDNGLSLNAQKTRVLLLGSRVFINALSRANPPKIVLAGTILEYSPSVKILGLVLDSKLNWDAQISSVSSKIHYALYSLRHHRNSLSRHLRLRLVQALIFLHLDYAAAALTSLTAEQKLRLQRL